MAEDDWLVEQFEAHRAAVAHIDHACRTDSLDRLELTVLNS